MHSFLHRGRRRARSPLVAGALLVIAIVACAPGAPKKRDSVASDTLTRRQKDSAIGASQLPGAGAVTRALNASDSVKAGVRRADSIATDTNP